MAEAMVKNIHGNWQVSVDATDEIEKGNECEVVEAAFHQGKELSEARIRELEADMADAAAANARLHARVIELEGQLSKAQDCAAHNLDRCGEQRKENAALKKCVEINECGRPAIEARDKEIKELREALGAADEFLQATRKLVAKGKCGVDEKYFTITVEGNCLQWRNYKKARDELAAALKGV